MPSFRAALAVALVVGSGLGVAGCGDDATSGSRGSPPADSQKPPAEWDLKALPKVGAPLREFTTPGGVLVRVLREGEEPGMGAVMDLKFTLYRLSGAKLDQGVLTKLSSRSHLLPGIQEGTEGMKPLEKRRLLVPWTMAYGHEGRGESGTGVAPYENLVFDVQWAQLVVRDMQVGTGPEAREGSKVTVHYVGRLEDGTVFDTSRDKPEPATFVLKSGEGGVIEGWVKGLTGMRAGGLRQMLVPAHLAYGERGRGKIPPHSDLAFVVELLQVE
jgi:FKBP-type peptidyl-prolyl cis-trans isomerase